jgi:hypothetical protein
MSADMTVEAKRCWCGGEVGPRSPGDFDGLGCVENITHEWDAMDCRNCEDIDPGAHHAQDAYCLRDKCEPGCEFIAPHPDHLCGPYTEQETTK